MMSGARPNATSSSRTCSASTPAARPTAPVVEHFRHGLQDRLVVVDDRHQGMLQGQRETRRGPGARRPIRWAAAEQRATLEVKAGAATWM
jgi:hypothetical protein